jgi:hypothetical protein
MNQILKQAIASGFFFCCMKFYPPVVERIWGSIQQLVEHTGRGGEQQVNSLFLHLTELSPELKD